MMKKILFSGVMALLVTAFIADQIFAADVVKLSPEKVVELAQKQNIGVKSAQFSLKAQQYGVKSAITNFLPTMSANASAMHIIDKPQMELGGSASSGLSFSSIPKIPGVTDSINTGDMQLINLLMQSFANLKIETPNNVYSYGLTFTQPVFTGGRLINAYRIANFQKKAQEFTVARTMIEVGLQAKQVFWTYVLYAKQLEVFQESRLWWEKFVSDQQKRFEKGVIIQLDLLNNQIQLDNSKLGELSKQNELKTVADQVLVYLGLPLSCSIDIDTSMLQMTDALVSQVSLDSIDRWIENRDDLKSLNAQIAGLKAARSTILAGYSPMIAAFANVGANNQYSTTEDDFKRSTAVGVQLNWSILDWGKNFFEAKKLSMQISDIEMNVAFYRDQIRIKFNELYRKVDESNRGCEIAREDLETARKALNIAKLQYENQAITNTDLQNARNQLTAKIVAYTVARIGVILAVDQFKVAKLR